jgi:hypothetical protein
MPLKKSELIEEKRVSSLPPFLPRNHQGRFEKRKIGIKKPCNTNRTNDRIRMSRLIIETKGLDDDDLSKIMKTLESSLNDRRKKIALRWIVNYHQQVK